MSGALTITESCPYCKNNDGQKTTLPTHTLIPRAQGRALSL